MLNRNKSTQIIHPGAERLSLFKNVMFGIAINVLFFGSLELLTRFVFTLNYKFEFNIGTWRQHHPTRYFSLIPGYKSGRLSINSRGFLGPEFQIQAAPAKVRILTIGDSVTFDPAPNNYSRILEARAESDFSQNAGRGYCSSRTRLFFV